MYRTGVLDARFRQTADIDAEAFKSAVECGLLSNLPEGANVEGDQPQRLMSMKKSTTLVGQTAVAGWVGGLEMCGGGVGGHRTGGRCI